MSYPGNPSLAQDVQHRIASTFEHALDLVAQGREPEAQLGCEFILRMDPMHRPAGRLLERLQSEERPVAVDDLRSTAESSSDDDLFDTSTLAADAELDDLGSLEGLDDLGSFDDLDGLRLEDDDEPVAAAATAAAAKPMIGFAAVLQDLLARRNFQQVLQIAETQKQAIEKDPQLRAMVESARAQLESEPYVQSFLDSARQASAHGQVDEARKFLDKARALAPDHPELDRLEAATADAPEADFETDDAPLTFDEPPAATPAHGDAFAELYTPAEPASDDFLSFDEAPAPAFASEAAPPRATAAEEGGGNRFAKLLDEGQDAFDRGEYQTAIDIWSRIFLIDIDNQEASRRIDEARNKKAELERQAEEIFHEGVTHLENRNGEEAKVKFRRVLALQPGNSLAREYLEQLEAGKMPVVRPSAEALDSSVGGDDISSLAAASLATGSRPAKSMEAAVERDRIVVVKKTDRRLIALGAAVLVLVLAAVTFLVLKWDDLFPNTEPAAAGSAPQSSPIEKATALYEEGNVDAALLLLQRIQPQDPVHGQAQILIAQWKAASEAATAPAETGPSEAQVNRRNLLLQAARDARAQGQYLRTRKYLERAGRIMPLTADEQALVEEADANLDSLRTEIALFDEGEYAAALPTLWRKRESSPRTQDVDLLIVDSYYNLALRDLQRGETVAAAEKLGEALPVDPDNRELQRLKLFAETYVDRPQDLLYRIFVKHLPSR